MRQKEIAGQTVSLKLLTTILAFFLPAGVVASQSLTGGSDPQPLSAVSLIPEPISEPPTPLRSQYVLGPEDQIAIRALHIEEIAGQSFLIDQSGNINLPLVGRVGAAGLTVEELETELVERLKAYLQHPKVTVNITQFRSQPVSILGAVNNPGVHQLRGNKTLFEMLSLAGGPRQDAGHSVKITRRGDKGRIPLATTMNDPTGRFSVAEVKLKSIMEASNPAENIVIQPDDVISVPRAEMVYVIGEVPRSGGFVLNERESMSVLQALSLAGGLSRTAAPQNARILRANHSVSKRTEIPVDLKKILVAKSNDLPLQSDDILFIPGSTGKRAALRALEAVVGMGASVGTGLAVYR